MAAPHPRIWVPLLSFAVGVLATVVVLKKAGVQPGMVLGHIPAWAHLLAFAACGVDLLARGARVFFVARALGLPLKFRTSVRAQLAGDALAAVTPSRLGSDPAKLALFRRDGVGVGQGGGLLLGEMASEASILLVAAGIILLLVPDVGWWVALGVGGYAATVVAAGGAALLASGWGTPSPPVIWGTLHLGAARWLALRRTARQFRTYAKELTKLPAPWVARALGAGALHIAARLAVLPVLVLSLRGSVPVAGPPWTDLILRPFFVLYATALLPPPGGGGGVELTFASVLAVTLPPATLAATLVWWRWYTFYLGALLGWLSIGVGRLRAHKILDTGPSRDLTASFSATRGSL